MFNVISACGISSCQKLMGNEGVSAGQDGDEVSFERLDCAFSLVGSFRVRWDKFVSNIVGDKVLSQGFGSFVVHDLKPDEMAELVEPLVRAGICVYNGCFGSTGQELEVDVLLVDRE